MLSFGATGKFYAQITNGAPFEVLLSADDETPAKLEKNKAGVAGSRFTYAIGKLVLWSAKPGYVDSKGEVLKKATLPACRSPTRKPPLWPGGDGNPGQAEAAARAPAQDRAGENISQAHQFVATGNAELGFVALSQVYVDGKLTSGSMWQVPGTLYSPIRQDAVVLNKGAGKPAVQALMTYLKSAKARAVIHSYGYDLP